MNCKLYISVRFGIVVFTLETDRLMDLQVVALSLNGKGVAGQSEFPRLDSPDDAVQRCGDLGKGRVLESWKTCESSTRI